MATENRQFSGGVRDYASRIREKRTEQGLSQTDLAEMLQVSKNAVANWEAGRTRPDLSKVPALCRALRISLPAFFGAEQEVPAALRGYLSLEPRNQEIVRRMIDSLLEMQEAERPAIRLDDLRRLYRNSEKVSAGTGNALNEASGTCVYMHLPYSLRSADELITVTGDSMEPTYHHGDQLLVEHTSTLRRGEIGIFTVDGEGYVKEYRSEGLYSHNPAYPLIRFDAGQEVRCVGRVLGCADEAWLATPEETNIMEEKRRSRRPTVRRSKG